MRAKSLRLLLLASASISLWAQQSSTMDQVLERLSRLEQENASLRQEVRQLRGDLDVLRGPVPAEVQKLDERLTIQERRVDEQAQTKVEAAQKFPVRLTGTLIANLFRNGPNANGQDTPLFSARAPGRRTAGLTFRQSIIGMEFRGPTVLWGGKIGARIFTDLYESSIEPNYSPLRLRTAVFEVAWKNRTLSLGLEKPLIATLDPNTFSYSGISPLTGSGNLWKWQPQFRFEQRYKYGDFDTTATVALVQTTEDTGVDGGLGLNYERRRPGIQGRLAVMRHFDPDRRVEFAPAFHFSSSHIGGRSVSSSLFAVDWFANPFRHLEFTGTFFVGKNVSHFGATRQSFVVSPGGSIYPVHAVGGWGQVSVPFTNRLSWNVIGGTHDDRNRDVVFGGIAANRSGVTNIMYRLGPNVIVSLEGMQIRTYYLGTGRTKNNRYDLSVAYTF